jgi:hypothetical protein
MNASQAKTGPVGEYCEISRNRTLVTYERPASSDHTRASRSSALLALVLYLLRGSALFLCPEFYQYRNPRYKMFEI